MWQGTGLVSGGQSQQWASGQAGCWGRHLLRLIEPLGSQVGNPNTPSDTFRPLSPQVSCPKASTAAEICAQMCHLYSLRTILHSTFLKRPHSSLKDAGGPSGDQLFCQITPHFKPRACALKFHKSKKAGLYNQTHHSCTYVLAVETAVVQHQSQYYTGKKQQC